MTNTIQIGRNGRILLVVSALAVAMIFAWILLPRHAPHQVTKLEAPKGLHIPDVATVNTPPRAPALYTLDLGGLSRSKRLYESGDATTRSIVSQIVAKADADLTSPISTVTAKSQVPPSGDKHDYYSLADYWWPDPSKPNGQPYIKKDGQLNPQTAKIPDKQNFTLLIDQSRDLSLAYYMTADLRYSRRLAALYRAWFIDPATAMNPNLNYAQVILGHPNDGTGVIDTRATPQLLDDYTLAAASQLTVSEKQTFTAWMQAYAQWLRTSPPGIKQSSEQNNHGTWYFDQLLSIAAFTGDGSATHISSQALGSLIQSQIGAQGSQPLELARTRSWHYSIFNLTGLLTASLAAHASGAALPDLDRVRQAVSYLIPYAAGAKTWVAPDQEFDPSELSDVLRTAQFEFASDLGVPRPGAALSPDPETALAFPISP